MRKKIVFGTLLTILFSSFVFFFYFNSSNERKLVEKKKVELTEKENIEILEENIESSNLIEDVSYSAKDAKGNEYFLKASEGTIDLNDSNIIFLKSVKANIDLKNYKLIEISSDFGKYNINNYNTIFSNNVIVSFWDKNLMIISKEVILSNSKSSLKADVIEVNIKTRDIKIFMYEQDKKVNIKLLE